MNSDCVSWETGRLREPLDRSNQREVRTGDVRLVPEKDRHGVLAEA